VRGHRDTSPHCNEVVERRERVHRPIKKAGDNPYHLRRQGKKYEKRRNSMSNRGQIKNKVSIDDRQDVVAGKHRTGDWEIDTVIGEGQSGTLVTIVERATKFTLSVQVNSKSAADVTPATIKLLKPFRRVFRALQLTIVRYYRITSESVMHCPRTSIFFILTVPGREV
jgi:IS30 family transposase